ncbi:hypothetical protein BDN70DRAFT_900496 [Pholiota conissans]|uniref:Uncharacterized protein n=1 Tax=Pholiota conissans TaxID=109636 RepID=A0A9P5YNF8_9AGAR|nr:hypothetical protein BDN70DRAFT_900496 [Pholiota conissans]
MPPHVNKTENSKNKQDGGRVKHGPGHPCKVVEPDVEVEERCCKFFEYADEITATRENEEEDSLILEIHTLLNDWLFITLLTFMLRDSPGGIPEAPGMTPDFLSLSKCARIVKGKLTKQYESPDDDVMDISNGDASPLASNQKTMLSSKSAANDDGEDNDNGEDNNDGEGDDDDIFPEHISNVNFNAARTTASAPKMCFHCTYLSSVKKSLKVKSKEEGEEAVFAYVFLFWCLYSVLIIFSPKSVQAAKKASALAHKIAKKNQKAAKKASAPARKIAKNQKVDSKDKGDDDGAIPKLVQAAKKASTPAHKITKKNQKIDSEDKGDNVEFAYIFFHIKLAQAVEKASGPASKILRSLHSTTPR